MMTEASTLQTQNQEQNQGSAPEQFSWIQSGSRDTQLPTNQSNQSNRSNWIAAPALSAPKPEPHPWLTLGESNAFDAKRGFSKTLGPSPASWHAEPPESA
jgi:hypothetical protein